MLLLRLPLRVNTLRELAQIRYNQLNYYQAIELDPKRRIY